MKLSNKKLLFLSKDFPCFQRGNPQKHRDRLDYYRKRQPSCTLVRHSRRGMDHILSNDSTRFRKACIFTTLTLRENTCSAGSLYF